MRAIKKTTLLIVCILFATTGYSQRYAVGDIVPNFTLTNRETNQPVSLEDFEGKIVFLEWFAYWCPFCQAAAEQTKSGIVDYYESRGGNANGVPVLHVGINLQGNAEAFTQSFVNRYGLELVLNDFNATLANRFQANGQPIFAIINGVKNSPSHAQWELLYSRLGYGDLNHPISTFRQAIDAVQAAPLLQAPVITSQPQASRLATGSTLSLTVQATGEAMTYTWFHNDALLPTQTTATLTRENITLDADGTYTVEVSNAGGKATSDSVAVEVVLSLDDYLSQSGLAGDDLAHDADPDYDSHPNVFEYLAQTNPNDSQAFPDSTLEFIKIDDVPSIRIQFTSSPDTIGVSLSARFWTDPDTNPGTTIELPIGQNAEVQQPFPPGAKSYLARLIASTSN